MTPDWYRGRPMSPHLQVWRWHWTMAASIAHRVTGVGNTLGVALIAVWIALLALGGEAYDSAAALAAGPLGVLFWAALWLFAVSLVWHLLNGVRFLVWDMGRGFEPRFASRVSIAIFAVTALAAAGLLFVTLRWAGAF